MAEVIDVDQMMVSTAAATAAGGGDGTRAPGEVSHRERREDVVVVGGGIAGLAAAATAARAGVSVTVLDAHELGGRARTTLRDGWSLNLGPHAVYVRGALQATLDDLGLELAGGVVGGSVVGFVRDGVHTSVRMTGSGLARAGVLSLRSRARALALLARIPRLDPAELVGRTVDEWLGDEPLDVQQFLAAFVRVSSYTHAPGEMDAGAAVAQLQLARHGVRYLDGGWGRIVDALAGAARQHGATIAPHVPVVSVDDAGDRVLVRTATEAIAARSVIVATGGPELATRLTGAPVRGREALTAPIRAASLDLATGRPYPDCFSLGLDRPLYVSPHAPTGVLAPEGRGLVCAMRYLAPGEDAGEPAEVRAELRRFAAVAGVDLADVVFERALHQSVVSHGSPRADGGGLGGRPGIDALGLPGVLLAGDWVGPEGMIGDASAASGVAAARAAVRRCATIAS